MKKLVKKISMGILTMGAILILSACSDNKGDASGRRVVLNEVAHNVCGHRRGLLRKTRN